MPKLPLSLAPSPSLVERETGRQTTTATQRTGLLPPPLFPLPLPPTGPLSLTRTPHPLLVANLEGDRPTGPDSNCYRPTGLLPPSPSPSPVTPPPPPTQPTSLPSFSFASSLCPIPPVGFEFGMPDQTSLLEGEEERGWEGGREGER